jgi:hypothetical protein
MSRSGEEQTAAMSRSGTAGPACLRARREEVVKLRENNHRRRHESEDSSTNVEPIGSRPGRHPGG